MALPPQPGTRAPLYGRDAERSRIAQLLNGARESRSGALVLRGEAGVGKSALLEDAREGTRGMRVLSSRGIESEAHLPFAAVHQLLRPVLCHLERLPEPQAGALRRALGLETGVGDDRFLVSLAVLSLLAEAAERCPLLCLVDDAHWLDDASADALVFVARRLEAEGIAMLFAARDGEIRRFEALGLPELSLAGLEPEAAGALIDRQVGLALSPEARERLIEGTGGNPLALLELPVALSEAQLTGAEPVLDPLPVSTHVEQVFLARVRRLPEETQALLLVAAAEGSGELAAVLRAADGLGAAPEALDAAEEAGLVHVRAARLEFRHPLVRSAVYHGAPLSRRRAAHRALAGVLDARTEADRLAWHRAAACVEPDASVVDELEQAAQRARRRSGFAAASLALERAAALTPNEGDRARRLTASAENAWLSGRPERALMLFERARPLASEPIQRADIDRGRGLIELNLGIPAEAHDVLVRAARDVASVDAERALYMLGIASVAAAYAGNSDAVVATAESAGSISVGDTPVARFLAEFLTGTGAYFGGDFARAAPSLRAAVELADEADATGSGKFAELVILAGAAGLFLGDDRAARRFNHRIVVRARDAGALSLLTQARPRLALSEIWEGQWRSASAALTEALELARQIGQHQIVGHLLSELAVLAALRGDETECRSLAAGSRELAAERRLVHVANTARWALLALELGRGRADDALASAREITGPPISLWTGLDRIEAAVRAGDRETAAAWLSSFGPWADSNTAAWAAAAALHCRALLCDDEDEAERLFLAALETHAGTARPFGAARTQLAYGGFLRRARRRLEAREQLRAAFDRFESLGATLWVERAGTELRASGQTARRRDPSTRDELTAQELQIVRFVADGLTNRQVAAQLFLSPRTIDFHLRNIFRKLDITSRTELARMVLDSASGIAAPAEAEEAVSPVPA
jgi:DNA-binding CsgD family transcriptional regulator